MKQDEEQQAEDERRRAKWREADRIARAEADRRTAARREADRIARAEADRRAAARREAERQAGEKRPGQEKYRNRKIFIVVGLLTTLCVAAAAYGVPILVDSIINTVRAAALAAAQAVSTAQMNAVRVETAVALNAASTRTAIVDVTSTAAAATEQFRKSLVDNMQAGKKKAYGPRTGELVHDASDDLIVATFAYVGFKNFIAEATFTNPYASSKGIWDYGFLFRETGVNSQYRLILASSKLWSLYNRAGEHNTLVATGQVPNLNVSENSSNKVWLLCQDDKGILYVNGVFVSELDLSARLDSGSIGVATGLMLGDEITGSSTGYEDFTIWSLP